jgi:hypothetical protein
MVTSHAASSRESQMAAESGWAAFKSASATTDLKRCRLGDRPDPQAQHRAAPRLHRQAGVMARRDRLAVHRQQWRAAADADAIADQLGADNWTSAGGRARSFKPAKVETFFGLDLSRR